jgi:hypothetical protein
MESTGKYWIPVFNILEEANIHVLLTHPKYVIIKYETAVYYRAREVKWRKP